MSLKIYKQSKDKLKKSYSTSVRLTTIQKDALKRIAKANKLNFSELITFGIERIINEESNKKQ